MSVPASLQAAVGTWSGTNKLFLPGEPTRESESTLTVALAAQGKFCTIAYTWAFEGEPQDGLMVIGSNEGQVVTAWIDSWHMGDQMMQCEGQVDANGAIVVRGSYKVEGHPDWGWRMVVVPTSDALRIEMYNVTPDGQEMLGVVAKYSRAG